MTDRYKKIFRVLFMFGTISSLMHGVCRGQDASPNSPLFFSDSIIEMILIIDLDSLLSYTEEESDYQDARLIYVDPQDQSRIKMDIEIRTRGNFRRKPENCDFPPLKLKFNKKEREGTIFENLKDVKLVTHCQTENHTFQQYVMEEYLIYKAYNVFTDFSFKVRLARISYVDLYEPTDTITRYAFILENPEHMAERNKCELLELQSVPPEKLDRPHYTLMSLFNYMMLNTDYSIPILHNVELVIYDHFSPPIPVPYDFDWSGIINIPYDSPYTGSKTKYSGREYKGPCIKRKEMDLTFSAMLAKREQLYSLYKDFPYLDEDLRSRSLQDLNMFFIIISSRELIRQEFIKNCED